MKTVEEIKQYLEYTIEQNYRKIEIQNGGFSCIGYEAVNVAFKSLLNFIEDKPDDKS